jgi:hypothetical protein
MRKIRTWYEKLEGEKSGGYRFYSLVFFKCKIEEALILENACIFKGVATPSQNSSNQIHFSSPLHVERGRKI